MSWCVLLVVAVGRLDLDLNGLSRMSLARRSKAGVFLPTQSRLSSRFFLRLTCVRVMMEQVAQGKQAQLKVFGKDYPTKDGTGIRDYLHICDRELDHLHICDRELTLEQIA